MLLSTQTDISAARLGYAQAIRLLSDTGYDALDFSFFQAQREGLFDRDESDVLAFAADIRHTADEAGIGFDQTHAPFSFSREMWNNWEEQIVPIVKKSLKASAALGAKIVVVHPIQYLNYQRNSSLMVEESLKYYRILRPYAQELGIRIALENMWQRNVNRDVICPSICASPGEFCALIDELGTDVFTACLDVGHCGLAGWVPSELVRALGHDRLGALHVHDNDHFNDSHTLPGFGKIDWEDFCTALGEIDYAGNFTFEADNFFGFVLDESVLPAAANMMVRTGRYLMSRVEAHRPQK